MIPSIMDNKNKCREEIDSRTLDTAGSWERKIWSLLQRNGTPGNPSLALPAGEGDAQGKWAESLRHGPGLETLGSQGPARGLHFSQCASEAPSALEVSTLEGAPEFPVPTPGHVPWLFPALFLLFFCSQQSPCSSTLTVATPRWCSGTSGRPHGA